MCNENENFIINQQIGSFQFINFPKIVNNRYLKTKKIIMTSLDQIAKKYQSAKKQLQSQKVSLRQQIQQQIEIQTINALKIQNHKVSQIHKNQKIIQTKLKRNNQLKIEIEKQLNSWISIYEDLNKSLKKAGDLAHYANFIQDQISQVCFIVNPQNNGKAYVSTLKQLED